MILVTPIARLLQLPPNAEDTNFPYGAGNRSLISVPKRSIVALLTTFQTSTLLIALPPVVLLREGFPPDQVIKTGSPMYEHSVIISPKLRLHVLPMLGLKAGVILVVRTAKKHRQDRQFNNHHRFKYTC